MSSASGAATTSQAAIALHAGTTTGITNASMLQRHQQQFRGLGSGTSGGWGPSSIPTATALHRRADPGRPDHQLAHHQRAGTPIPPTARRDRQARQPPRAGAGGKPDRRSRRTQARRSSAFSGKAPSVRATTARWADRHQLGHRRRQHPGRDAAIASGTPPPSPPPLAPWAAGSTWRWHPASTAPYCLSSLARLPAKQRRCQRALHPQPDDAGQRGSQDRDRQQRAIRHGLLRQHNSANWCGEPVQHRGAQGRGPDAARATRRSARTAR